MQINECHCRQTGLLASIADRIGRAISDDSWPGCAIRFRAESNDALAQRIGNSLLVGPADAPCTQGGGRLRTAKGHRDAVKFRDAATTRQRVECTRDIRRHRRRSAAQKQLADSGQKTLEASVGRAPALGEPDLHIACAQDSSCAAATAEQPRGAGSAVEGARTTPPFAHHPKISARPLSAIASIVSDSFARNIP